MIEFESQLFKLYSSLEKLESLDKFYYKKDNYKEKDYRYLLRSDIIDTDSIDWFNTTTKNIRKFNFRELNTLPLYDYLYDRVGLLNTITTYRYVHSYYQKTLRLKRRINRILELDNLFFITFTFDDRKLKKGITGTKQVVLRKYVVRWLKEYCNDYVGNIDFGGKNGRLHFHAVISCKNEKIDNKTWKYGAINFKIINSKNDKKLAQYTNKLCSHALKESTKAQYLIYPKKK